MFERGDAWVWQTTLTLNASGKCDIFVEIADPGNNQRVNCNWLKGEQNNYAIWVQEGRLRVYLNGARLIDFNLPKIVFQSASLAVDSNALPVSFGAFRIAQSVPNSSPVLSSQPLLPQIPQRSIIHPKGSIEITDPPSGDVWYRGEQKTIAWISRNVPAVRADLNFCDDEWISCSVGVLLGEWITTNPIKYAVPNWMPAVHAEVRVRPDPGPLLIDADIKPTDPDYQEKYSKVLSDWENSAVEAKQRIVLADYTLTFTSPKRPDTYPYEPPIWSPNSLQTITWSYRGYIPPVKLEIRGLGGEWESIHYDPYQVYNGPGWARFTVPNFPLAKDGEYIRPYRIEAWVFDDKGIGSVISTSDLFDHQPGFSNVWDPSVIKRYREHPE